MIIVAEESLPSKKMSMLLHRTNNRIMKHHHASDMLTHMRLIPWFHISTKI